MKPDRSVFAAVNLVAGLAFASADLVVGRAGWLALPLLEDAMNPDRLVARWARGSRFVVGHGAPMGWWDRASWPTHQLRYQIGFRR